MPKDVLCNDGLAKGMMEVARQLKIELDALVEISNEQVNGKRWQRGIIDESEETAREEGGMWRH